MPVYAATTFSPVQDFIEKSRKLRDLYGGSIIISHLSARLVKAALAHNIDIISPGMPDFPTGMPNRILLKNNYFDSNNQEFQEWLENWTNTTILVEWKKVLTECQNWIQEAIPETTLKINYTWQREWLLWGNHTWEIFWGAGNTIPEAMEDLEDRKLSRNWTATNWIGESSSLTGTDAIAWPGLADKDRNPINLNYEDEKPEIKKFYEILAEKLETKNANSKKEEEIEGKFIDPNERLSIPELTKRLVTQHQIRKRLELRYLESFTDIVRKPEPEKNQPGQWTGWFMGDGDRVGKYLKKLAELPDAEEKIRHFSEEMRKWGRKFMNGFNNPRKVKQGRVIYAGGDDFLGVIYRTPQNPVQPIEALEWLKTLPEQWEKHGCDITLSVGFVWAAPSVPQRDVLQHCRTAEKKAKKLGRDRLTIRVLFNSGRFIDWTCPWDYLHILDDYRDREGGKNWTHVYNDLEQLKARHAIKPRPESNNTEIENTNLKLALALINLYFQNQGDKIKQDRKKLVDDNSSEKLLNWISDLILVGWQMCS